MLLHPGDIQKEEVKLWKEQLRKYAITQPIRQLTLNRGELTKKLLEQEKLEVYYFDGWIKDTFTINSAIFKHIVSKLGFKYLYSSENPELCLGIYFEEPDTEFKIVLDTWSFDPHKNNGIVVIEAFIFQKGENKLKLRNVPKRLINLAEQIRYELINVYYDELLEANNE